jgi:hypothetical protein
MLSAALNRCETGTPTLEEEQKLRPGAEENTQT